MEEWLLMADFWDPEKQSWDEYKASRFAGHQGMGQPNSQKNSAGKCNKTGEVKRSCKCRTCINRRNRSKGKRKQVAAMKQLNIPSNRFRGADSDEENWKGNARYEVKAGKQHESFAKPFYKAKEQSDANHKAIGSLSKPFIYINMPDGRSDGIVAFRTVDIENACMALLENFGYSFEPKQSE
tara:strand:- start:152 stop:697 length:546 start_codon:yes stop_codon:yes gene_type:complete